MILICVVLHVRGAVSMHNVTRQQERHRCGNLERRQKGRRTYVVQPIHSLVILHLSFIDAFAHCAASVNKEQSLENYGEQRALNIPWG